MIWFRQIRFKCLICFWMFPLLLSDAQEPGDLIWKSTTGWKVRDVSSAGDVNDDGISDVFVASSSDMVICYSGGGFNKGEILWTWPIPNDVWSVTNISDVNHDGVEDCLAGGGDNQVYCLSGKPENGSTYEIWKKAVNGDVWTVAPIGDLDNDGIDDCLAGSGDNHVYCYSGFDGFLLWSYMDDHDVKTVHAIPDVNNDGKEDCLAGGHGNKVLCISGGSSGTGELLWSYTIFPPTGASVLSVAPIKDVDGDSISDCLASGLHEAVYCLSGGSSVQADLIWTYPTGANVLSVTSIPDVNKDGFSDCLAGGLDDSVFCISGHTGTPIWSYSTDETVFDVATISDVNNDGIEDCIAGSGDNRVHCIDGELGTKLWRSNPVVGSVICIAALPDININGMPDVIGGSDDSFVYVYEGGEGIAEYISLPNKPTGPINGKVGETLSFNTGGASSNHGHDLDYRFDWGDSTISDWGTNSCEKIYLNIGVYSVKVQARCQIHKSVFSDWSTGHNITISGHLLNILTVGNGSVTKNPHKNAYNHNENVVLTPVPSAGYQFDHWEGDLTGNIYPETLVMNGNKSVTAHFSQIPETVSTPNMPEGVSQGNVGDVLTFVTGGAKSNLDHPVAYRFDWGDRYYSNWGDSLQTNSWAQIGFYAIKAQARCAVDTTVESDWSEELTIQIGTTGVEPIRTDRIPTKFYLSQNYPNPFNSTTAIEFQLPCNCQISIHLFNINGEEIKVLAEGYYTPGIYRAYWNGKNNADVDVSSGTYIYRINADNFISTRTLLLLK